METQAGERIRATIGAGRDDADRIVAVAVRDAERRIGAVGQADRALAAARIEHLRDLRRQIEDQQRRVRSTYAAMAEAMAQSAIRLVEAARDADFSSPPRPSGLGRTVEVRLAQTREIRFRIGREDEAGHGSSRSV